MRLDRLTRQALRHCATREAGESPAFFTDWNLMSKRTLDHSGLDEMNTELIDANIERALSEFKEPDQIIANLALEYMPMTLVENGFETITEARKRVARLRIKIEAKRKELKEGSLKYGRAVDGEAKRLTTLLEPIETHLEKQEAIHNAERDRIKEEKKQAAAMRLQTRLNRLAEFGVAGNVEQLQTMDDDDFELFFLQQKSASDRKRIEEQEIAAELDRQAAELRARQLELEAERQRMREQAEEIEKQRLQDAARMEAERAEIRREQEQLRREAEERAEAEGQRVLAERRAEEAKELAARQAIEEAARLARIEALRPEIEKAESFQREMMTYAKDTLTSLGNPSWAGMALGKISYACHLVCKEIKEG
jgi:septal ring factor EnvC (AmiA/AmiB activator)